MIEYIIEFYNPDRKHTGYSFYRGETKEEVEDNFKKEFPKYTIITTKIHNRFKVNK